MKRLTRDQARYLLENYATLGPTQIAEEFGMSPESVRNRMRTLRAKIKASGEKDVSLYFYNNRDLYRAPVIGTQREKLRVYGFVAKPDPYSNKDPRPDHIVITEECRRLVGNW